MTRIFITLAWFAFLLMAAALILGLSVGDIRHDPSEDDRVWATIHRLTGIAAALAVVLVNSIVVTYFIGTSRWCKEVTEAYQLDPKWVRGSTRLKRRTFPWALISMLTVVGVVALGGAADPATRRPGTELWVTPHLIGSLVGLIIIGYSFVVQWNNIHANHEVINYILAEVRRIRSERGLEV